jgi:hypothetical protein
MYMFSLPSWLSSSTSTTTSSAENIKILERLSASGAAAFADQKALMVSWSKKQPSAATHPAIIAQLAKNMAHKETDLTYKILSTLWISKLDPANGHLERAAGIHDLLNSGELDAESVDLFKAFAHELSQAQWIDIQMRMSEILKPRNDSSTLLKMQAARILGVAFPHVSHDAQKQILASLYDEFNNTIPDIRHCVAETLGSIFGSMNDETEFEDTRNESIKEGIISQCIKHLESKNNNARNTALEVLANIAPHAKGEQRNIVLRQSIQQLQLANAFVIDAAISAACACFKDASVANQTTIKNTLSTYMIHKETEFRDGAVAGLAKIYKQGSPEDKTYIITTLEQALLQSPHPKMQIAKTLHGLNYEKSAEVKAALKNYPATTIWNQKAPSRKVSTGEELSILSHADRNVLEFNIQNSENVTVHDHLITFCAKTFRDVNINYSADDKARTAMQRK